MTNKQISFLTLIVLIILGGYYFVFSEKNEKEENILEQTISFTDPLGRFSFSHGNELFPEMISSDGEYFLVKNKNGENVFQLRIIETNEKPEFSKENIQNDIPNINISSYTHIFPPFVDGVEFMAEIQGIQTFEMWFFKEGFLYQASAYPSEMEAMKNVLKTIQF